MGRSARAATRPRLLRFEEAFRRWVAERGMGWERTFVAIPQGGGVTTAYRLTPPGPARRTVLTLHGAGNDALFAWVGLFKRLLLRDTEIFTFDLPGHGRSNETRFTREMALSAVTAALERCGTGGEERPLHAVGVSLGGSVLLRSLPVVQERITSAILVVAPLRIVLTPRSVLGEIGRKTLGLLWRERKHYGLTGLIPSFGPFKRDIYPLRLAGELPGGAFGYVAALNETLEAMELERAAASIDVPVLLIYGTRDEVVPVAQGERLARLVRGAQLYRVPGGTHLSTPLEAAALDHLIAWMDRHE